MYLVMGSRVDGFGEWGLGSKVQSSRSEGLWVDDERAGMEV